MLAGLCCGTIEGIQGLLIDLGIYVLDFDFPREIELTVAKAKRQHCHAILCVWPVSSKTICLWTTAASWDCQSCFRRNIFHHTEDCYVCALKSSQIIYKQTGCDEQHLHGLGQQTLTCIDRLLKKRWWRTWTTSIHVSVQSKNQ